MAEHVVVGVDPSPAGRAALRWALREAAVRRLPVTAVRAWSTPAFGSYYPPGSPLASGPPEAAIEAQALVDEQVKLARERVPGADVLQVTAAAEMGSAGTVLVEAVDGAAMVVLGDRGTGALSRAVLGSVTASVLHHVTCPVVVVPDDHDGAGPVLRVLVGVDQSPQSLAALGFAVQAARHHDAVLVPVFVHEPVRFGPEDGFDLPAPEGGGARAALLAAAAAAGAAGLPVEPQVLIGHPAGTLTRLATPQDLLVLGSRGRGGFAGLLLGSTSTQCAQHARCPVVVVRDRAAATAP